MPERTPKRKASRDSLTRSIDEPEETSLRTENAPSISDRDFSEISEKIEKSVFRSVKGTETGQREILKMVENLSSKIDSLSAKSPNTVFPEVNETNPESLVSTSRPIEMNELPRGEGQHNYGKAAQRINWSAVKTENIFENPLNMNSSRWGQTTLPTAMRESSGDSFSVVS